MYFTTQWHKMSSFCEIRTGHLLDLSLDLPLGIEFYDLPSVINHLQTHMGLAHVISWPATSHIRGI